MTGNEVGGCDAANLIPPKNPIGPFSSPYLSNRALATSSSLCASKPHPLYINPTTGALGPLAKRVV